MFRHLFLALGFAAGLACAQDPTPADPAALPPPPRPDTPAPTAPTIERLDETRYRIGEITFDQKSREIRFPAIVNMTEGLLEYAVVHVRGKVHESLLATEISPTHLNVALKLLRYPPSPEFYNLPNEQGGLTGKFPVVPKDTKAAARVQVKVEWDDNGKTRAVPINEWIQHVKTGAAMPATLWVYGGSKIAEGKFVAEVSGSIIATYITNDTLMTYPGEHNDDDTIWIPYPKRVPEIGTKVTVIIAPNPDLDPSAKPQPDPSAKPDAKPTAKPAAKPTAKPSGKPTSKPTAKP